MDPNVIVSIVVCLGSAAAVVWRGGVQAGRVEAAVSRLVGLESKLSELDEIRVQQAVLVEQNRTRKSEHKELRATVEQMRSRLPSAPD